MARLGVILFLFTIVLLISICQAVLLKDPDAYDDITDAAQDLSIFDTILDIVGFFFGAFLIQVMSFPAYMIVIITPIYLILLAVFWYLVLDFIKDIEIFGISI